MDEWEIHRRACKREQLYQALVQPGKDAERKQDLVGTPHTLCQDRARQHDSSQLR